MELINEICNVIFIKNTCIGKLSINISFIFDCIKILTV